MRTITSVPRALISPKVLSWIGAMALLAVVAAGTASVLRAHSQSAGVKASATSMYTGNPSSPTLAGYPASSPTPAPRPKPPAARPPVKATAPVARPAALPPIVVRSTQQALINQDRARYGLPPLSWNSCLASIAYSNAVRMAKQGYISHTNGPARDLGCHLGYIAGENVGWWSGGVNDTQINSMFMNSADHRANILGHYHYVATAWVTAPNGHAYIAVEFA
jgi:uncharacterized protein YkwD